MARRMLALMVALPGLLIARESLAGPVLPHEASYSIDVDRQAGALPDGIRDAYGSMKISVSCSGNAWIQNTDLSLITVDPMGRQGGMQQTLQSQEQYDGNLYRVELSRRVARQPEASMVAVARRGADGRFALDIQGAKGASRSLPEETVFPVAHLMLQDDYLRAGLAMQPGTASASGTSLVFQTPLMPPLPVTTGFRGRAPVRKEVAVNFTSAMMKPAGKLRTSTAIGNGQSITEDSNMIPGGIVQELRMDADGLPLRANLKSLAVTGQPCMGG